MIYQTHPESFWIQFYCLLKELTLTDHLSRVPELFEAIEVLVQTLNIKIANKLNDILQTKGQLLKLGDKSIIIYALRA